MGKIIVDREFWDVFPDAQLNVMIVKNIDNHCLEDEQKYFTGLLHESSIEAKKYLSNESFSQNPVIDEWRKAFSQFKTKKGARSSIEALLKRVSQDKAFSPINPLVDIYNSISLKYAVPCGGEDLHLINGDLHLGKAKGGESFLPLGADDDSPALPEEIIYYDTEGAICRCLNWREAQRTMLTEDTTNAILVMESINEGQAQRANRAMAEMKERIGYYFNTESITTILNKEKSTFDY